MLRPFSEIKNFALAATDGEIGKVKELYFDDRSWVARYVVVDTSGWLHHGRKVLLAPRSLGSIHDEQQAITVSLSKEQIESSPSIDADKPVSRQFEEEWHGYYGYPGYWVASEPIAFGMAPSPVPPPAPTEGEPREDTGPNLRSTSEVAGYSIHATDGDIGELDDFIVEDATWSIRYVTISRLGKKVMLSAEWIERVSWEERKVFVPLHREMIEKAPEWDDPGSITREYEERLHDHYGRRGYWPIEL